MRLIGDIGGTNARFALVADDGLPSERRTLQVAHYAGLAEAATADRIVLLAGRIVAWGTPEQVLTEEHLVEAYRGRLVDIAGQRLLDDPHHHGARADRHAGGRRR